MHKIKLKLVKFKAYKEFKAKLSDMHFQCSKYKPYSAEVSNTEIDMKLTEYFTENQIIIQKDFQYICKMTQITAFRHIKKLITEKKLHN